MGDPWISKCFCTKMDLLFKVHVFILIYLKSRETERMRSSTSWFTPLIPTTGRVESSRSQELSRSPKWMAETQVPEMVYIHRKSKYRAEAGLKSRSSQYRWWHLQWYLNCYAKHLLLDTACNFIYTQTFWNLLYSKSILMASRIFYF